MSVDYNGIIESLKSKRFGNDEITAKIKLFYITTYFKPSDKILDVEMESANSVICAHMLGYTNCIAINSEAEKVVRSMVEADGAGLAIKFGMQQPTNTAFKNLTFDGCIHMLKGVNNDKDRLIMLKEVKRILKKGGLAIIPVWDYSLVKKNYRKVDSPTSEARKIFKV